MTITQLKQRIRSLVLGGSILLGTDLAFVPNLPSYLYFIATVNRIKDLFKNSKAFHPFGLGADLKGLFFQSNFGIVTQMTLSLPRLPKFRHQCYFAFPENVIAEALDKLIPIICELTLQMNWKK